MSRYVILLQSANRAYSQLAQQFSIHNGKTLHDTLHYIKTHTDNLKLGLHREAINGASSLGKLSKKKKKTAKIVNIIYLVFTHGRVDY